MENSNSSFINGFKIVLDKTPPKWSGSIYVESPYKELAEYVTSPREKISEAIEDIFSRYPNKKIKGISLKKVSD